MRNACAGADRKELRNRDAVGAIGRGMKAAIHAGMTNSADTTSDTEFLAEPDTFECAAGQPGSVAPIPAAASVIVRAPAAGQIRAAVPLFLMTLIGVGAGAASFALLLHLVQ